MGALVVTFIIMLFLSVIAGFWVWVLSRHKNDTDKSREEILESIDTELEELEFQDRVIDRRADLRDKKQQVEKKAKAKNINVNDVK